jgi:hypothetical protein
MIGMGQAQPEYSDIFTDDGSVPGGSCVKENVPRTELDREVQRLKDGLTEEEKRMGVKVYSKPATYPPSKPMRRRRP